MVAPEYAKKEFPANLATNLSVAKQYVLDNPGEYEHICSINPEFAKKFALELTDKGPKLQKRR